jgi:hypothetical protein
MRKGNLASASKLSAVQIAALSVIRVEVRIT